MESQLRAEDLLTAAAPVAAAATTTYAEGRHAGWWDHSPQPLPDASPAPTLPPGPPEESPPFEPAGPGPSMSGGPVAAEPGLEEPPGRPAPHLQALVDEELIDLEAFAHLAQLPDKDDVAALQREQSGADTHGPSRPLRSVVQATRTVALPRVLYVLHVLLGLKGPAYSIRTGCAYHVPCTVAPQANFSEALVSAPGCAQCAVGNAPSVNTAAFTPQP